MQKSNKKLNNIARKNINTDKIQNIIVNQKQSL